MDLANQVTLCIIFDVSFFFFFFKKKTAYEIIVLRDVTEKRQLQRQVLEIASREQQRVGQELHDVLLQDLTGLALLADAARHGLGAEGGGRELMAKLSGGLEQLNAKVRALCEGLIPVEIDG